MKSRYPRPTGLRRTTEWDSNGDLLPEKVLDLLRQGIVEILWDRDLALGRTENELLFHQANLRQQFAVIKVAANRIGDIDLQLIQRIGLREDGMVEGAGYVAAFGRFPHRENNLAFPHIPPSILAPPTLPCLPDHLNRVARKPWIGSNDWPLLFDSLSNQ